MMSPFRSWCAALFPALLIGLSAAAADLAPPSGPAIVTVTGEITENNRPPFEPFRDKLFDFNGVRFDRAAAFDLAMLEGLGMRTVEARYRDWSSGHTFEGPLLKDVLTAAGATGKTVLPMALDGYAAEIPMSDLEKWPVILAVKMDGKYMDVGGAGPAFVIYPLQDFPELADEDDAKLVWGVFHIAVE